MFTINIHDAKTQLFCLVERAAWSRTIHLSPHDVIARLRAIQPGSGYPPLRQYPHRSPERTRQKGGGE